jgi:hypothetical protein
MAEETRYLEKRQEESAIERSAGFSRKVSEIRGIYYGGGKEERYEAIAEWLYLLLKAQRQIEKVEEINFSMGGYSNHLPLDQYLFLKEHFGESSWEIGSQSIINVLCSFLSSEELERVEGQYPNLKYSEINPIEEQRLEDFIERVESFG